MNIKSNIGEKNYMSTKANVGNGISNNSMEITILSI